jgi:DNA-binding transcriptional MerR regulator
MGKFNSTQKAATQTAADLLTDAQAAEILTIEPRTLRLWRNTRALPFLRITPRVIRYRRADLESWLDATRTVIS